MLKQVAVLVWAWVQLKHALQSDTLAQAYGSDPGFAIEEDSTHFPL